MKTVIDDIFERITALEKRTIQEPEHLKYVEFLEKRIWLLEEEVEFLKGKAAELEKGVEDSAFYGEVASVMSILERLEERIVALEEENDFEDTLKRMEEEKRGNLMAKRTRGFVNLHLREEVSKEELGEVKI